MKQTLVILAIFPFLPRAVSAEEPARRPSPYTQRLASHSRAMESERMPTTAGDSIIHRAARMLEDHTSVASKIKQHVHIFGQQLIGSGTYLQQGRGAETRIRLELRLTVADETSSLLQVSDGHFLWIHQQVLEQSSLRRLDVTRIQRVLQEDRFLGRTVNASGWPAPGGLPRMLDSLARSFQFADPREGQLGGLAVYTLAGQWEPTLLASLLPAQKERILAGEEVDLTPLAEQIPHRVVLALGRDDLFPYRLEFWRSVPVSRRGEPGLPREQELLTMDFLEVEFNRTLDDRKFQYRPGEQSFDDYTDQYLRNLSLGIE